MALARHRGEDVHKVVQRIDRSMAAMNRTLRKFGAPQAVDTQLTGLKKSVGDLIAKLEMIERRQ